MKIEVNKKQTKIKIQHDIPAPSQFFDFPFEDMGIGDSFFAPLSTNALNAAKWSFMKAKRKSHWLFTIRKEKKGARIWRLK